MIKEPTPINKAIGKKYSELRNAFQKIINGIEYDVLMEQEKSSCSIANKLIRIITEVLEED